jgi:hypothetical protein
MDVGASFLESRLVAMAQRMQGQIRLREVPGRSAFPDLARDLFWHGDVHLTMVLEAKDSSVTVLQLAADANSGSAKSLIPHRQGQQTSSVDFHEGSAMSAERGNWMAVTDSQTLQRLRREESLAEQQGRQALNISMILKNHPQYDAARQKADALLAKASALREQIGKIETD